jgi:hypothetical protein
MDCDTGATFSLNRAYPDHMWTRRERFWDGLHRMGFWERRLWFGVLILLPTILLLQVLWGYRYHSFTPGDPLADQGEIFVRQVDRGLLRYHLLQTRQINVRSQTVRSEIRWVWLATTIVSTALILTVLVLMYRGLMSLRRDWSACRKCGYNVTGIRGARCPECGADIDF